MIKLLKFDNFRISENTKFFSISDEKKSKLTNYINQCLNGNQLDLTSWIYSNIIRGKKEQPEIKNFIESVNPKWKKLLDDYLNKYNKGVMKCGQDSQNEWFGVNYNSNLKQKEVKDGYGLTKNFYVTFEKTEENLKKWFNGIAVLISDFYKSCAEGDLKNSAISFKCGYSAEHFVNDNDHLKFYWYKDEDKDKILKIYNNWLNKTGIKTQKRAYDFGVDREKDGDKNSFGLDIAKKVNDKFQELKSQYGKKFSGEQYADYIIDMLNKTKFKI